MNLILNCTGKSLLTLCELILLCKNGFPDGALGLARNLFEQFIIISVFEAQCEGTQDKKKKCRTTRTSLRNCGNNFL